MIELVLPSTHPSPQPKRQISRFSCFCTAHGRKSLYFTMGDPFPEIAPSHGGSEPPSNSLFPGLSEPTTQRASRPVLHAVFAQMTAVSLYFTVGRPVISLKIAASYGGIWTPIQYMVPWDHPSPQSKRHLDRFSRFCRAH